MKKLKKIPIIPQSFEDDLRMNHIRFITQTSFLQEVFTHAEKFRATRYDELLKIILENTYAEFYEKYGPKTQKEFYNMELFYKPMLLKSFFLIAYSNFEVHLRQICERMEKKHLRRRQLKAHTRKLKKGRKRNKSFVEIYRDYLKKIHGLKMAQNNAEWKELDKYRTIRNALVHDNGLIDRRELRKVRTTLDHYKVGYNFDDLPIAIRDENFLQNFITLASKYTKAVIWEVAPVPPLPGSV